MDELYRLAFAYRKTKLWHMLSDSHLFAVAFSDGETGYCSVMGGLGEHIALAVYPGEAGLRAYCTVTEGLRRNDGVHDTEYVFSQDCLVCSFENKDRLRENEIEAVRAYCAANGITLRGANAWPQMLRYLPFHLPWPVGDELGRRRLAEALEAALEVAARLESAPAAGLGLVEGPPGGRELPLLVKTEAGWDWRTVTAPSWPGVVYPQAGPLYDLPLKRASMNRKRAGAWACDVFLLPKPSTRTDVDGANMPAPFFPWVQLVYDLDSGMILDTMLCGEDEDYAELFPNKLLELIEKSGKPRRMLVETDRTAALYRGLAKKVGFPLELVGACDGLDEALGSFFDHFSPGEETVEEVEAIPDDFMEQVTDLYWSAGDFTDVPDKLLLTMGDLAETLGDWLPRECRRMLELEIHRRFS